MIDALADDLPDFSQANRTCCFLHIVNLIAKTLLKQFDVPGKQAEDVANEAERLLLKLVKDIDIEEMMTRLDTANKSEGDNDDDEDNVKGWVDEMKLLSEEERKNLGEHIAPVRLVLVTYHPS